MKVEARIWGVEVEACLKVLRMWVNVSGIDGAGL